MLAVEFCVVLELVEDVGFGAAGLLDEELLDGEDDGLLEGFFGDGELLDGLVFDVDEEVFAAALLLFVASPCQSAAPMRVVAPTASAVTAVPVTAAMRVPRLLRLMRGSSGLGRWGTISRLGADSSAILTAAERKPKGAYSFAMRGR